MLEYAQFNSVFNATQKGVCCHVTKTTVAVFYMLVVTQERNNKHFAEKQAQAITTAAEKRRASSSNGNFKATPEHEFNGRRTTLRNQIRTSDSVMPSGDPTKHRRASVIIIASRTSVVQT